MVFIKDVKISNCGTGIKSNMPVSLSGGSIINGGIGMELTGRAAMDSYIEGTRFDNLRIAIQNGSIFQVIPQLAYLEKMDPSQREVAILEIAANEPNQREEAVKNGPIGQFLRRQNIGDWAAVSTLIAQGVSIAFGN